MGVGGGRVPRAGGRFRPPAAKEARALQAIAQARRQLAQLAASRTSIETPRPVVKVDRMEADAGDVWRGEAAHFVFHVRNDGDMPLEIEAKPSCSCTVAKYDRVIAPGGETALAADILTTGMTGRILKQITLLSNDSERQNLILSLNANVRAPVEISPANWPTIILKEGEPTVQEFNLVFQGSDPVNITQTFVSAAYGS